MKRLGRMIVASILVGTLSVTPVLAADIDDIKEQKQEAQSAVNSLQQQLTDAILQIDQLEKDILKKVDQIAEANADLEAARVKEAEQYEAMKLRIRYMYEAGGSAAVEKIFTSGSITEMLNQAEYVQTLHSYDREMLAEYVQTKNEIADLKSQLEQDKKNMEELSSKFTKQKDELNVTLEQKRTEVSNLDEQLQAAIAEAQRKAAEEEARRQQEENNKNNAVKPPSGAGNGGNNGENNNGNNDGNNNNTPSVPETPSTPQTPPAQEKPQEPAKPETPKPPVEEPSGGNQNAAAAIVNAAYSQLGVPYEWGGTTPGVGLDCSGLTQYCHRMAGISIPRTSGDQLSAGRRVSDPQPGDICWTPGHVAIYIGNGQMIEAPDVGQVVKISKVRASAYVRYW